MLRPVNLLAAFLFIGFPLFGQQDVNRRPSESTTQTAPAVLENHIALQSQDSAKFLARTDLVLVPVIVTDKSGKHVCVGGDARPGWRKLKVKIAGDGLRVRYRSGFYFTPKIQDSAELRRKQLVDALASPVQYNGLRLSARFLLPSSDPASTYHTATSGTGKRPAEFMLGVMGDCITIDREKDNAIDLEVITLAFDSNHKSVATTTQAIATGLKPEMMQKTLRTGLGIPEKLDLAPGKYEVKFAVRDNVSGLLGTVTPSTTSPSCSGMLMNWLAPRPSGCRGTTRPHWNQPAPASTPARVE